MKWVNKTPEKRAPRTLEAPGTAAESRVHLRLKTWHRSVLILTLAAMAFTWLAWLCTRDPKINFLPRDGRAEWILFPRAMEARAHRIASLDTVFRREFDLDTQPRTAGLEMRAAKRAELRINGTPVEIVAGRNWKAASTTSVVSFLRAGRNSIDVKILNDNAPPSLWLTLTADEFTLRSDGEWEASFTDSAWRPAALAATPKLPGPGNPMAGGERVFHALRTAWPIWLLFAGAAAVICIAGRRWLGRFLMPAAGSGLSGRQIVILLAVISGFWVLLFWNNASLMPFLQGFDAEDHLDYIKYVQEHHALPLPTEGFEMFQPPLYYVLSAVALSICGLSADAQAGVLVLRFLTLIFGPLQFTLVFLSLRLFFPGRLAPLLIGLVLAAVLPMQIYLSHFVTNETLAATLVTASLYVGLRLLRMENPSVSQYAWLGLCLGAAMLTKATAILLVPPIFLALATKLAVQRAPVAIWLRHLGALSAIFLATCGWHYVRIWRRFGTPLVGNWNTASGFPWWQDPGFHTAADYAMFGQSLIAPLFSGLSSFADGIYSTLWGDGLCGGVTNVADRPPWNYDLMAGGYLLALAPTFVILTGAAAIFWRYVRKPSTEGFVLIAFSAAVTLGVVFMTLKVASYAQVKAFYGLALLVPICLSGAVGWEVLTRGRRVWQGALGIVLLVWAMNSFASFWIVPSASQHLYVGRRLESERKLDAATKAIEADPANADARRFRAAVLSDSGRASEALSEAQRAVELSPLDGACRLELGLALARQGQTELAISETRRALELGPENPTAYDLLIFCLSKLGRHEEVITVARDGLAQYPFSLELHYTLGIALAQRQDLVIAANHFVYSVLLRPDLSQPLSDFRLVLHSIGKAPDGLKRLHEVVLVAPDAPLILNEVAWFFATHPDATLRNGSEAVRLAEHACALTRRMAPEMLATLAAAYAESGRISEAVTVAEEARARSTGNPDVMNLTEKLLATFRGKQPFRDESAVK